MDNKGQEADKFKELRNRAETLIKRQEREDGTWDMSKVSLADIQKLVHELEVYQTELELQNDELRRAQAELAESRDKYADLYDFAPVGYFTLNRKGLILEVNLSGARMVNRERRDLIRQPFVLLISAEDHSGFFSCLERTFQRPFRQSCELKLQSNGQEPIHARLESIAVPNEGGKSEICRVAISDITESKRVRDALVATQTEVLSNMAEGVCVCDETGSISFANAAFEAMFDYDMRQSLLLHVFDCEDLDADVTAVLPDALYHALANGNWRGDLLCRKRGGESFYGHLRIRVLKFLGTESIIFVWEDISDLKRAQQELLESERLLRTIFDGAQDLIFLKDRSLKYTRVNPAFAKLFGKSPADIRGLQYEDLFGPEGADYEKDLETRVLSGQTIEEERVKNIKGGPRRFSETRVPIHDVEGVVIGLCGISRDVTERLELDLESSVSAERVRSTVMERTLRLARRAAKRDTVILLMGESGSGKDYLARYIHDHSGRSRGPHFSVNCAALPLELAESELFGHESGAFTGALSRKRGLLEMAEGGTLLLNEIGDLPLPLQSKLLTFLDARRFTRVGGENEITVNARLMFATNKDLEKEVEERRFRRDLFYRISVMTILVPPLRDRIEDIELLAQQIMSELAKELQLTNIPPISPASKVALTTYDWPGNVRELRNVLERSLMLSEGETLNLILPALTARAQSKSGAFSFPSAGTNFRDVMDGVARSLCVEALLRAGGNRLKAARLLGISRDTLYRYLRSCGLDGKNQTAGGLGQDT